jgi:hypothetical protein
LASNFDARLSLARLGGLGPEAIDEGLQSRSLRLLPRRELAVERLALAPLTLECGVTAAIERELSCFQVENPVDGFVE